MPIKNGKGCRHLLILQLPLGDLVRSHIIILNELINYTYKEFPISVS